MSEQMHPKFPIAEPQLEREGDSNCQHKYIYICIYYVNLGPGSKMWVCDMP